MRISTPQTRANDEAFKFTAKRYTQQWQDWPQSAWELYGSIYSEEMREHHAAAYDHRYNEARTGDI